LTQLDVEITTDNGVLLGVGANGESELVGIFLTTHKDSATLQ